MQKQTGQKDDVTSNTQSPAKKTDKENYLTDNIPLENGLTIRRTDEKWFTTLGDTIITEPTHNYSGQLEQIDDINYKLIIKIAIHIQKTLNLLEKTGKTLDKLTEGL